MGAACAPSAIASSRWPAPCCATAPSTTPPLRDRSRLRSDLVKRRTQLSQKIRSQLLRYFPEMWEVAEDLLGLWGALFLTLWERAPTPAQARRLRRATLAKLLKQCRIRRLTAEDLHALFHRPALVVAPGLIEGAVEAIEMLVEQLQVVNRQVKTMDRRIEELLAELPAVLEEAGDWEAQRRDALAHLRSMDGAGPIVAAGLFGRAVRGGERPADRGQLRTGPGLPGGRSGDQTVRGEPQGEPTAGGEPPWTKGPRPLRDRRHRRRQGRPAGKEELRAPRPQIRPHPQNHWGPPAPRLLRHAARWNPP